MSPLALHVRSLMEKILWHKAKHITPKGFVKCCESFGCSEWKLLFEFYLLVLFSPTFVSRRVCTARVVPAVPRLTPGEVAVVILQDAAEGDTASGNALVGQKSVVTQ